MAVPAAAIIGFVLGIWTNSSNTQDDPLTALIDTIYIKVPEKVVEPDTIVQIATKQQKTPVIKRLSTSSAVRHIRPTAVGRSIADDKIRYDLLVKN